MLFHEVVFIYGTNCDYFCFWDNTTIIFMQKKNWKISPKKLTGNDPPIKATV